MPVTGDEFIQALTEALNHLYDVHRLKNSPLMTIPGLADTLNSAPGLQQKLLEMIRELEPKPGEPAGSINYRNYMVLTLRYEQQYSQKEIARQMGLSVRQCRRAQAAAVGALAARMWNQFGLALQIRNGLSSMTVTGKAETDIHRLEAPVPVELAWVQDLPADEHADLQEVYQSVSALVEGLAKKAGVELSLQRAERLPRLIIHPVSLRHILLDILNLVILKAGGRKVEVSATTDSMYLEMIFPIYHEYPTPHPEIPELAITTRLMQISRVEASFEGMEGGILAKLRFPLLEQIPILVVDDMVDTLQLLQRYSTNTRYRLITTQYPAQVAGLVMEMQPRAIVMDIMMPELDGWDLLTQLKSDPTTRETPILVCTVLNLQELAFTLGARGFLKKPPGREDFLLALDNLVTLG